MAEGGSERSPTKEDSGGAVSVGAITADMLMGQSKSSAVEFIEFKDLPDPHTSSNKLYLVCAHCKCTVMGPGYGSLVQKEIFLPSVTEKYKIGEEPAGDTVTTFWLVKDMFHFENVGFSKTVNGSEQYLICADCEIGPIGWHNIQEKKEYYVAAERVTYATT